MQVPILWLLLGIPVAFGLGFIAGAWIFASAKRGD
jgi:uncharacterized protein YneF (UPF0154 family)